MRDARELRGPSPLVAVVSVATALVVLVCVVAATVMLLGTGASSRPTAEGAAPAGQPAPTRPSVTDTDAPGVDEAVPGGSGTDLELATAAVVGMLGSSACDDVPGDTAGLGRALGALGDPTTWIPRGLLDGAVGRPVEAFAEACGSLHASAVVEGLELPDEVAGPLAAYVANGGARSTVDASTARDRLAAGVPADLLVGTTATRSVRSFMLPSGNIACTIDGHGARCEIADARFGADPAGTCEGVWGGVLAVGDGVAEPGCLEEPSATGEGTVLRYGESTRAAGFSCASSAEGVACRNDTTGHGFWLRSTEFRVF